MTVLLDVFSRLEEFDEVNDVRMVESLEDFDFLLDGLQVETRMGVLNDLDGAVFVNRRSIAEFDSKKGLGRD